MKQGYRNVIAALISMLVMAALSSEAHGQFLVSGGEARAAIVTGNGSFYRFVGEELQRYFERFTGSKLEILGLEEARRRPRDLALVLVGGPQTNALVREATAKKLVSFEGLKPDGFILKGLRLEGRRALVVGGNDEAATMYAAYDLVERYGAVFLLTGDILPERQGNLEWRDFDVRSEPAFWRRGLNTSFVYPNFSIMSMADMRKFLDQMAKMKLNYLQFGWLPTEPWLKYEYRGEVKWMGDVTWKEGGYTQWARDMGSFKTTEMLVGQEHFKAAGVYPRLAAPEFQHIEDNEQGFAAAQKYLHEMIAYAASRKIKVWLQPDGTSVAPNLARYTTRALALPFDAVFGTFICPNNPVSWELNENRLKSMVQTYPEAEGYFWYIPEAYPVCFQNEKDREFYWSLRSKYPGEAEARAAFTGDIAKDNNTVVDSNSGSVYLIQKLMEARDRIAPQVKMGIAGLGRLYLWPYLDKMFPKSVPFTDMESRGVWTPTGVPMEMFGGMEERENTLANRIDDDSAMLGMQFNVNLYYKDQVLEGGLKYGLAGFASQVSRPRGTETNTKYMAEGEWNPHLTPEGFYRDYAKRIFGERAAPKMLRAFETLEKNEEYLGWTGRGNFGCCGPPRELSIAYEYYKQPNPFDGPTSAGWQSFINEAHNQIYYFTESIKLLKEALEELQGARAEAEPGSQAYLAYLINRTEAYILHLQTLISWEQAYLDLDSAFQARKQGLEEAEFVKRLDRDLQGFEDTQAKAQATAKKWSEIMDHPSDLGVLYRINVFMVMGTELATQLMQNIDNFYHGRDYVQPVNFEKIFVTWPTLATTPWQSAEGVASH
jgi:hypothetical protein